MQPLVDFFSHPIVVIVNGFLGIPTILIVLSGIYYTLKGILPVWRRLGLALTKREIAIFADERFNELKDILVDSGLFQEKNIIKIDKASLKKAETISVYLVDYACFKKEIDDVMALKRDSDAMIIYSPPEEPRIVKEMMNKLNSERNTTTANFRGRLLNDVIAAMISTGFKKQR
ncbi:MAG: hypothetical protein AAF518_00235 [Spirochaetota bacterium]